MDTTLEVAVRNFTQVARDLGLENFFQPFDRNTLKTIQQQIALPDFMIEWYVVAAPKNFEVPSFGNCPILLSPEQLPNALLGYNFNPVTNERISSWNDTWIVFGGEGRYPLIVRTADTLDTDIYYGEVKKRTWQLVSLSSNLEGFLLGLSDYLKLYFEYNSVICNDDGVLLQSFQNNFTKALNARTSTAGRSQIWLNGWLGL